LDTTATPISLQTCMGSFDCVDVRFANVNFAQDDNYIVNKYKQAT